MRRRTALAKRVEERASGRCEYCQMHQSLQGGTFHVEHVVPRARGGRTVLGNLAWACPRCNLQKSDRVLVKDAATGRPVALFNPRTEVWADHFRFSGYRIVAITVVGRATLAALDLNHPRRLRIRRAEKLFGLFPPA